MILWKWEGTKYPWTGGTGENTPFAKQSKEKEWDNGHNMQYIFMIVFRPAFRWSKICNTSPKPGLLISRMSKVRLDHSIYIVQ